MLRELSPFKSREFPRKNFLCNRGWHNRLNSKAEQRGLCLCDIVALLQRDFEMVDITVAGEDLEWDLRPRHTRPEKSLQDTWDDYTTEDLKRDRRPQYTRLEKGLQDAWDDYMADDITTNLATS